jgi:4-hydroxy-3-methylbut-2-enyl diphosphate reductase
MDSVLEASTGKKGRVRTLGPLIHNPQALLLLEKRGVSAIETPDSAQGGTVVVRAHGIPVHELRNLKQRHAAGKITLVNATCPEVAKVHARIKKWSAKGYYTVILGTHGHAESLAHRSFAEIGSTIVSDIKEARELPDSVLEKVLVVAQTTFTAKDFDLIVEEIRDRCGDMVVENTICEDTKRRQEEAERIAAGTDSIVVVGGKSSSNTKHLAHLAQRRGVPVQFVELASELDLGAYVGNETIGVLAGASTPTWLVDEVVHVLQQHGTRPGLAKELTDGPMATPTVLSLGVAAMAFGLPSSMGLERSWPSVAIVFAYALAMYLATPFLDPFGLGAKGPARARRLERRKKPMLSIAAAALGTALALAASIGGPYALAVTAACALGIGYKLRLRVFGKTYSIRAIPGSKDVFGTLALAVIGLALPAWQQGRLWEWRCGSAFLLAGALAFARNIITSLADMQKDQVLGRETLPILIGRNRSLFLMHALLLLAWGANAPRTLPSHPGTFAVLTACTLYPILYQWMYRTRFHAGRPLLDPGVEPAFFLAGLMAAWP